MDLQKPILEQINQSLPDLTNVQNTASSIVSNVANTTTNLKNNSTSIFSTAANSIKDTASNLTTTNFIDSNHLFIRLGFLTILLFIFVIVAKLGISLIGYYTQPNHNPYVVKGILPGNSSIVVPQDPRLPDSVPILRSIDAFKGAEFTWSIWLFLGPQNNPGVFRPIFVKGVGGFDNKSGINSTNGPGMYVTTNNGGSSTLRIVMDTVEPKTTVRSSSQQSNISADIIEVPNMPHQKWVHVAVLLKNMLLDVYVNGIAVARSELMAAPRQNYYDVQVCPNGGFVGSLSDLRYFNKALSVFGINNILLFGPSKESSKLSEDAKSTGGTFSYLSDRWYTK